MAAFELRTDRLVVRPWRSDEAAVLHEIRGRRDVAMWLGNGDEALSRSVAAARELIEAWHERATAATPGGCAIVPEGSDVPVGTVLLNPLVAGTPGPLGREVEVGWHLHPDAVGHGWASEAAAAMLAHGLDHHDRVWAIMWPANEPSARVAGRSGMEDLGEVLDPWYGSARHPHSRIFVAGPRSTDPGEVVEAARRDLAVHVRDHAFPDEGDPGDAVTLPGWQATAARLLAARH